MSCSFVLLGEVGGVGRPAVDDGAVAVGSWSSLEAAEFSVVFEEFFPAAPSVSSLAPVGWTSAMHVMLETPRETTEQLGFAGVEAATLKAEEEEGERWRDGDMGESGKAGLVFDDDDAAALLVGAGVTKTSSLRE